MCWGVRWALLFQVQNYLAEPGPGVEHVMIASSIGGWNILRSFTTLTVL